MSSDRAPANATVADLAHALATQTDTPHRVALEFDGWTANVCTSSAELGASLRAYWRMFASDVGECDATILAYDIGEVSWGLSYEDWKRAPGKTGKKEQIADLVDGWVVRKVRTGMRFALGRGRRLAVGPCREHPNQIVNFVNAAFMSQRLDEGWLLCHAAAVARAGAGVAIAGVSGAGKSTLALHAMNRGLSFVSNDRLLVRAAPAGNGSLEMAGVPKHPRINPGTALANPSLRPLVAPARRAELEAMDPAELWHLEDKYDADIGALFDGRWTARAPLSALVLLNWSRDSAAPTAARPVSLAERPDLLPTIVKHPGPLHLGASGRRPANETDVASAPYLDAFANVQVVEITGAVDFDAATEECLRLLS